MLRVESDRTWWWKPSICFSVTSLRLSIYTIIDLLPLTFLRNLQSFHFFAHLLGFCHRHDTFLLLLFLLHLQSFPVAASSLCLLMLSLGNFWLKFLIILKANRPAISLLDRYATVKHPRFTQLRQRQYLPSVLAFCSWFGASVLCIPFLLVYKVTISSTTTPSSSSSNGHQLNPSETFPPSDDSLINVKKLCISDYGSEEWHFVFIVSYVSFAFIVPCFGIIFNHLGQSGYDNKTVRDLIKFQFQVWEENCARSRWQRVHNTGSCRCLCQLFYVVLHTWFL